MKRKNPKNGKKLKKNKIIKLENVGLGMFIIIYKGSVNFPEQCSNNLILIYKDV